MLFDELEFPIQPTREVSCNGVSHRLKPFQAIIWLSVRPQIKDLPAAERARLPPDTPQIPAILDTGNNSTLSIQEAQLRPALDESHWRFSQNCPRYTRDASGRGTFIPKLWADVWLRADNPPANSLREHRIQLGNEGINFYPDGPPILGKHIDRFAWERLAKAHKMNMGIEPRLETIPGPHLPILGLGTLCRGNVHVEFRCEPTRLTVRVFLAPQPMD